MSGAAVRDDALGRERVAIDGALAEISDVYLPPAVALSAPIREALAAGGKRLRPVLCLGAERAVRGGGEPRAGLLRVACAVEIVHGYSLIHDDLPSMDDAALRRGRPATHRRFGVDAAVLAGAAMIPLAFRVLDDGAVALGLDRARRARLAAELAAGAGAAGMVGGQVQDLAAEGGHPSLEAIERLHGAKTGALLTAALRMGAIAGGAGPRALDALTRYGRAVGLAFQIADDLLDLTGSPADTGKAGGADIQREKATFPALLGIEAARSRARSEVDVALRALETGGLDEPLLVALARYAVERDR